MSIITTLFWFAVAVIGAMALGWLFRAFVVAVSPQRHAQEMRKAPLTASFGLLVILIYVLVAALAPVIAPFGESEVVGGEFLPWDSTYLLGTDNLGRDMLTRMIYGARNTVGIAFIITALAFFGGTVLGLFAAVVGGWLDQGLSRFVDVLMAIPSLIFSLLLLTIFGTSVLSLVLVIATVDATRVFRLARSVAQGIVVMDYIEAARLRGEGKWWLITREILPNAMAPLVAEFGLRFCFVFLAISGLSFLGLGIQPPTADWGGMVRDNATLITFGDLTPFLPAGAIALLTVAVNFVVDWQLHRSSGLKE
ncbi:ABC transporter permease [Parasedimentitalea marina]|uniref:ABC transporter permease n=1 Tax=Parasedimentitalea marina TaxID=2483033 RepID=A0A3T0N6Q9_9RHOB|nr:ABC transporter permease [Parasedimentitalea marina]AZV79733.1 ABC transporter permease [Parasedimentitalea marina]